MIEYTDSAGTKLMIVPDTNFLLHYQWVEEISWRSDIASSASSVGIVLPVIRELDKHSHSQDPKIARRARRLIRFLEPASEEAVALKERVSLSIMPDPPGHQRVPWTDEEIIELCIELSTSHECRVALLSSDLGMRLTARTSFTQMQEVIAPPARLLLDEVDGRDREIADLRTRLSETDTKSPKLTIAFSGTTYVEPDAYPGRLAWTDLRELIHRRADQVPKMPIKSQLDLSLESLADQSPTNDQRSEFNLERKRWLGLLREWHENMRDLSNMRQGAIELPLTITNMGSVTCSDIEIRVALKETPTGRILKSGHSLSVESLGSEPEPPQRPEHRLDFPEPPLSKLFEFDPPRWSIALDGTATAHLDQIRPDKRPRPILDGLFVVSLVEEITPGGFALEWEIFSATPDFQASGELHVTNRK